MRTSVRTTSHTDAAGIVLEQEGQHAYCVALLNTLHRENYRFTTVSPATHALINRRAGNDTAADLRGIFGWSRRFDAAMIDDDLLCLMHSAEILVPDDLLWRSTVRVSSIGSQLFMHSAFPTLREDSVFFGPDTYRFIHALERHIATRAGAVRRAVDIGCGAGPGAIMIARAFPTADVSAVDINDSALRMTAINAAAAQADNVHTLRSNLLTDVDGVFDLVIANPPYMVDAGERTYRHGGGALGEGLSIDIVRAALSRLAPGGTLLLYTGVAMVDGFDCFLAAVQPLLVSSGYRWSYQELDPDIFPEELATPAYRHAERIAAVLLEVTRI
jgi:SAM-dependent methyltransferase